MEQTLYVKKDINIELPEDSDSRFFLDINNIMFIGRLSNDKSSVNIEHTNGSNGGARTFDQIKYWLKKL